jgi:3-isopropylmalate/(R)-2-methylmalate dehydratase large subunit
VSYAKDVILTIIRRLGVHGGVGFAYEYGGSTLEAMTIDERMTICNMSIEGGARIGYVNPDETTFAFLRGRRFAPAGDAFDRAVAWWRTMATDANAAYDDRVRSTRRDRADRHLGDQPGPVGGVTSRFDADPDEKRWRSWGSRRARASRARGSTSRSSARARTAACRISRKRRASCAGTTSRRT